MHDRKASPVGLLSSRDYPVGNSDYSSFGVAVIDSKGGVGPRTTQFTSHKYYCWLGGGNFVSSKSRDYSEMVAGDCRGVVGPRTTHFFFNI